ncbi:YeiH family protein [Sphingosinicella humi]|uniref:YeiH family protein n=1 Tax=Allosphingosinicella humi TaxID=2068657 RepID=UPI001FB0C49B|nr:putative sulfate exporter family transporter [Sphingosinicella humi]
MCGVVVLAAAGLEAVEIHLFGRAWIDALVLAILVGTAIRSVWTPGDVWQPGIDLSAKFLLEVAVVLLGATLSASALAAAGWVLLLGIALVVALSLAASYGLGRLFGLPRRMAVLIACGNSICGNSAIAAVAPVIGAESRDVAASIAFTAVLGVAVVLLLPFIALFLGMEAEAYGVLAGLTVYAVPQVLAATAPISSLSAQVGTMVKLVRVLMLGPVVLCLSLLRARLHETGDRDDAQPRRTRPRPHQLLPWFIVGFLLLAAARAAGAVPEIALAPLSTLATWLTILAMAALGLGVDVRTVAKAGGRIASVVTLSLLLLGVVAWLLIGALGIA